MGEYHFAALTMFTISWFEADDHVCLISVWFISTSCKQVSCRQCSVQWVWYSSSQPLLRLLQPQVDGRAVMLMWSIRWKII